MISSFTIGPENEELRTKKQRIINTLIWLTCTSRNALLVIVCGLLGYFFSTAHNSPFQVIGMIMNK